MRLSLTEEDERISDYLSSMLRYLSRRRLLVSHPDSASLVRLADSSLLDHAGRPETAING